MAIARYVWWRFPAQTATVAGGCLGLAAPGSSGHPLAGTTQTVRVADNSDGPHDVEENARQALSYWEANAEEYAGFEVGFELDGSADADLVIAYGDDPRGCENVPEYSSRVLGCAPLLREGTRVPQPITARVVAAARPPGSIRVTTQHELGHMLGLTHDDPPGYVMETNLSTFTANTTRVAFETADGDAMDPTIKQEASTALDYYAERNVSSKYGFRWQEVATPEDAHLVIRVDSEGCAPDREAGSCIRERYYGNQNTIMIDEIDDEKGDHERDCARDTAGDLGPQGGVVGDEAPDSVDLQ